MIGFRYERSDAALLLPNREWPYGVNRCRGALLPGSAFLTKPYRLQDGVKSSRGWFDRAALVDLGVSRGGVLRRSLAALELFPYYRTHERT